MCDPRAMCPEGARHGEPLRVHAPPQRVIQRPQQKVGEICGLGTGAMDEREMGCPGGLPGT